MSVIQSRWAEQAAGGQRQFERGRATGVKPDPEARPASIPPKAAQPDKPKP